ncbi:MAG: DinB family protein [Acidobacteria bacterium]|nr:DinB family protein [Acidobacteriota bacterium]MCL5288934.1 DinB family protein [Acidobacteriota bacterium]
MFHSKNGMRAQAITLVCAMLLFAGIAAAQAPKAPPATSTPGKDLVRQWNGVARRLAAMAEDFPADRYDWKPAPEVRSFAEQVLHAAGYACHVQEVAKGLRPKEEDPPRANFKTKADVVAYVKRCFADGAKAMEAMGDAKLAETIHVDGWTVTNHGLFNTAVEHAGEHYGQLVVYYRVNKMVPPESRPRK